MLCLKMYILDLGNKIRIKSANLLYYTGQQHHPLDKLKPHRYKVREILLVCVCKLHMVCFCMHISVYVNTNRAQTEK